jgi:thermitase
MTLAKRVTGFFTLLLLAVSLPGTLPSAAHTTRNGPNGHHLLPAPDNEIPPGAVAEYKAGELLVKFKAGVSSGRVQERLAVNDAALVRELDGSAVQVWAVPEGQELALARRLSTDPNVAFAQPNYRYQALTVPDDPGYSRQWTHSLLGSPEAWEITTGSAAVTIANIDTGIDLTHPDLVDKLVPGYDFVEGDAGARDGHGHGTHVAGVAAATSNNHAGVTGVAWQARIMPVRVLDEFGVGWDADIVEGIRWAYQNGADVLNLSLGGAGYSPAMQDVIDEAHAAGSLVVAAMGNCRVYNPYACPAANPTMYPAAYENVMAVAATNRMDEYAYYSQYGSHCDIAAPGGEMQVLQDPDGIYSTMPTYPVYLTTQAPYRTDYDYLQGTSQATPYVAGLAALIWSLNPTLTPDEVQQVIQATAVDLGAPGWDMDYGYGRIHPREALEAVAVPGVISSLRVTRAITATGTLTVTLQWDAPAFSDSLELRYANVPVNATNWVTMDIVASGLPGDADAFIAPVPYASGTVYFALRSRGYTGMWSEPSNNAFWPDYKRYFPFVAR